MTALTFDEYRAVDAVNWSRLKHLSPKHGGSPLRYRHMLTAEDADTVPRAKGRAAHTLLLEPERFDRDYVVFEHDRTGNRWKDFKEANADRTILKTEDVDDVRAMVAAIRADKAAAAHLVDLVPEQSVVWKDPTTGLRCKARLDGNNRRRRLLVDLKTTVSIEAHRFGLIAARLGYPCQLAHYFDACVHGLGFTPDEVVLIAVENSAPFDVGVFVLDDDALTYGSEIVAELRSELRERLKSGSWPGMYRGEVQALQLPAYLFADDDELETFGLHSSASGGAK